MAAKILILALVAVALQAQCQLNGETIYKNPLRPPFAAESSVYAPSAASALSESNISQILGASVPNSMSVPFSQSSQLSSRSSTKAESTITSSSAPLANTNEFSDKDFSESVQQTKFRSLQPSKSYSANMNSKALNYSPVSKRIPTFAKNNITAFFPPPGNTNVPTDTGVTNKPQYLPNLTSRPYPSSCSSQINVENLKRMNPRLEQFEKPCSSVVESSFFFQPKETSGYYSESDFPVAPYKRTSASTVSKIVSTGSDFNSQYQEAPKTFSSLTDSYNNLQLQPAPGISNTCQGSWSTPILKEAPSYSKCEMQSLPMRPFPNTGGSQLDSCLYNTPILDEVTKPFASESSILPTQRFSASRRPLTALKKIPNEEEFPPMNLKTTGIKSKNNCDKSRFLCDNLKTTRNNFAQTDIGKMSLLETQPTSDYEYGNGVTQIINGDTNECPDSNTINIPQTFNTRPLQDSSATYDLNEIKKNNPVPSFIGITEIFNTGRSSVFENSEPYFPLSQGVAKADALASISLPKESDTSIYDMAQSIAQSNAISEVNINPTTTPCSYPQQTPLSFVPYDFTQTTPMSPNPYSPDFNFYSKGMSPSSSCSTNSAPMTSPTLFSATQAETSDSYASRLGQSRLKTLSSATSYGSAQITPQVTPSFPYKTIKPVSSISSTESAVNFAKASSSANFGIEQSVLTPFKDISSLESKQDSSSSYFTNSYCSSGDISPSISFNSLQPATFEQSSQTEISLTEVSSPTSSVPRSTALPSISSSGCAQASLSPYLTNSYSSSFSSSFLAPEIISPITTGISSTTSSFATTENIAPFFASNSATESITNPIFTPYSASQTINLTPSPTEFLVPAVESTITTEIGSTSSSIAAARDIDSFSELYSNSQSTSELSIPVSLVYSPTTQYATPVKPLIDIPLNTPETTCLISTSCAASDSTSSVPMATETFVPISYVPAKENMTPTTLSTSSTSFSYASSDNLNEAPDTIAPVIYPTIGDNINSIMSSAISKSTSCSETIGSDLALTEILPILEETTLTFPVVDTVSISTATVSSATECNDSGSSISTSSSIATIESPVENPVSTVQQTSTSSASSVSSSSSYATHEINTPYSTPITNPSLSRPNLSSRKLYNLEVSPITLEVQIPSSLGFGYAPSKTRNAISSPFMYELQIPSSMAAQLSCSLGSTQTNMPVLCMNVENVPSGKCY